MPTLLSPGPSLQIASWPSHFVRVAAHDNFQFVIAIVSMWTKVKVLQSFDDSMSTGSYATIYTMVSITARLARESPGVY